MLWAGIWISFALLEVWDAIVRRDVQGLVNFILHLQVALLFLIRQREKSRSQQKLAHLVAVASTFYPYLYNFESRHAGLYHPLGPALTFMGSATCFAAMWSLGKCFGVLPICRGVSTNYMYSFVRHPVYLSYILMDIGIVLAFPHRQNMAIFLAGLVLYMLRIHYEEELLSSLSEYAEYLERVRYRLIPGIY